MSELHPLPVRPQPEMTADFRPDRLDAEALRIFWGYWSEVLDAWRADRTRPVAPLRDTIAIERLARVLDKVSLLEVIEDPTAEDGRDYRYRVYGSANTRLSERELTHHAVSETRPFARGILRAHHARTIEEGRPVLLRVNTPEEFPARLWHRLACPVSSDGTAIDRILAISVGEDYRTPHPGDEHS